MTGLEPLSADEICRCLGLQPHPREGGFYVRTYESSLSLAADLPPAYTGPRHLATAIYYLITATSCSAMHRVASDEMFHFYLGDPVEMLLLRGDGSGELIGLGPDLRAGQRPQVLVPGGTWQGSCLQPGGAFALLGATVTPGFDFADYEHGDEAALVRRYPQFAAAIRARSAPTAR